MFPSYADRDDCRVWGTAVYLGWPPARYVDVEPPVIEAISTARYRADVPMTLAQQTSYAGFGQDVVTFQRICEDR